MFHILSSALDIKIIEDRNLVELPRADTSLSSKAMMCVQYVLRDDEVTMAMGTCYSLLMSKF